MGTEGKAPDNGCDLRCITKNDNQHSMHTDDADKNKMCMWLDNAGLCISVVLFLPLNVVYTAIYAF